MCNMRSFCLLVSWLCPVNLSSSVCWSILWSVPVCVVVVGSVGLQRGPVKGVEIIFKARASPARVVLSSWIGTGAGHLRPDAELPQVSPVSARC